MSEKERTIISAGQGVPGASTGVLPTGAQPTPYAWKDLVIGGEAEGGIVYEHGLPQGSQPITGQAGRWAIQDIPVLDSIDYEIVYTKELEGKYGTLRIYIDDDTKEYYYEYLLNAPVQNPSIQGKDTIKNADVFELVVKGPNNEQSTLTIKIDIVDDIPAFQAALSEPEVIGTEETAVADITAFLPGADGLKRIFIKIDGEEKNFRADGPDRFILEHDDVTYVIERDAVNKTKATLYVQSALDEDKHLIFQVFMEDGDGDIVSATGNDSLELDIVKSSSVDIEVFDSVVHEAALKNGTGIDWLSNEGKTTTDLSASGRFILADDVASIKISLGGVDAQINLAELNSGDDVVRQINGDWLSISKTGDGTYSYSYVLGSAKTHDTSAGTVGETKACQLKIDVTTTKGKADSADTNIIIVNDEVMATGPEYTLDVNQSQGTFFTFILDHSGSMSSRVKLPDGTRTTRFELVKNSIYELIAQQKALDPGGEIGINMVAFNSNVKLSGTYEDVADALRSLDSLGKPKGCTYFDRPLNHAQNLIEQSMEKYPTFDQKVYFISDGSPSCCHRVPQTWKDFVNGPNAADIDVYAVGVGPGASRTKQSNRLKDALNEGHGVSDGDMYIPVDDPADLANALGSTIATTSVGNFFTDGNSLVLGADGDFSILQIECNGKTYSLDGTNPLTLTIEKGVTLTIHPNGEYELQAAGKIAGGIQLPDLTFTVRDADGDTTTFDTSLKVNVTSGGLEAFDNVGLVDFGQDSKVYHYDYMLNSFGRNMGKNGKTVIDLYEQEDHAGVTRFSSNYIIVRAQNNIDYWMPKDESGDQMTMRDLFAATGMDPNTYIDAGFMTIPEFQVSGASVVTVNYYWDGGHRDDLDSAFWVLVDTSTGKAVKFDKFASGDKVVSQRNGILSIVVDQPGNYKVMLIAADGLKVGGRDSKWDAYLKVYGAVIEDQMVPVPTAKGNVIYDPSPEGEVDYSARRFGLKVTSIKHDGQNFDFNGQDSISLQTAFGTLIVYSDGNYSFFGKVGIPFEGLDVEYTLTNSFGETDTASLHLRDAAHTFKGDASDETLYGTDGNDYIHGGAGNDVIYAGDGNDVIYGGTGDDLIYGGAGNDTIHGGEGNDTLYGGEGDDVIYGGAGNDVIYGGEGNDTIYGGEGDDLIYGGEGDDLIYGGAGNNVLFGGEGADIFAYTRADAGGTDLIRDFSIAEGDALDLTGLMSNPNAGMNTLLSHLELSVHNNHLSIIYNDGSVQQAIEANIVGEMDYNGSHYDGWADFTEAYSSASAAAQEAMLQELALQLLTA